jgi:hypothetical protein
MEALPQPPESPPKVLHSNGRVNWLPAYIMQSMMYLLRLTNEEKWAQELVVWGVSALADRDAAHPRDGRPYAWTDRSDNVREPYVWSGFTGHMFAPLMEFSRHVMEHPELQTRTFGGKSYRDHAVLFMQEFERALDVHLTEFVDDGRHAFFRFARPVPVANKRINGQPLPVNMNATLFTAMLHLSKAQSASGAGDKGDRLRRYVERFVAYLNEEVLERTPCGAQTCVMWQYSTYIARVEDVGHANVVVKFLTDARDDGYPVSQRDLAGIARSVERLIGDNGTFHANLLDGSKIPGSRQAIYYIMLLTRYSPDLKAKITPIVTQSRDFAYRGPWLWASR